MDSALARMETLVSIVMPTLNAQAWVVDTIDSVLAQTYPHIELIVVDDGSTDDTVDVVRRKLAADFKGDWRVIGLAENRGPSVARNVGLAAARDAWIPLMLSEKRHLLRPILVANELGQGCLPDLSRVEMERIRRTAHNHIADAVVALHKLKRKNSSRPRRTAKTARRP